LGFSFGGSVFSPVPTAGTGRIFGRNLRIGPFTESHGKIITQKSKKINHS